MMSATHKKSFSSAASKSIMLLFVYIFALVAPSSSFIVPQELPSILSLVYSNIPPIKKGTDSRLGFGFRLGEHADFQVLMELGPQKETKPIGDQDNNNSFNKRQVNKDEEFAQLQKQMRFKIQRLQQEAEKRQQQQQQEQQQQEKLQKQDVVDSTERNALSWLESWSQNVNTNEKKPLKPNFGFKKQELKKELLPTLPTLNEQSLKQLQLLYKFATTEKSTISAMDNIEQHKSEAKNKQKITKELMDVRLNDEE